MCFISVRANINFQRYVSHIAIYVRKNVILRLRNVAERSTILRAAI